MNWESQLARAVEEKRGSALVPSALNAHNLCRQKQYGKALEILWGMLRTTRSDKALEQEAFVLIHIGKVYRNWIWDIALKFFNDGLEVAKSCGFSRGEMIANSAMAELNYAWGKYPQAIEHHKKSLELAGELSDSTCQRDIILDMVECYGEQGEFDTCDQLLDEASRLDRDLGMDGSTDKSNELRLI